ncbi:phage tail assembly protein [Rouxiella sp. T17]|uniref:phage tail assembly protein n=1 Tax=Rouxiella sp. T17 TaxID=3085684 RepID=UPI002FC810F6
MKYPGTSETITLYSPLILENGSELTTITMREPLVRDRLVYAKDRGNEEEKETRMLALLCDINDEDMQSLTMADQIQLQETFNRFMLPPAKRQKSRSSAA